MFQVTIAGRLGRDAELRTIQSGTKVLGFSIAVDTGFGDKKKTYWVDCTIWGDRGEKLAQHLTKGTALTVTGEGGLRTWEKDGKSGAAITCNVRELTLQGGKRDGGSQSSGGDGGGWDAPGDDGFDSEVPF